MTWKQLPPMAWNLKALLTTMNVATGPAIVTELVLYRIKVDPTVVELSFDLEGTNHGRHGGLSKLQITLACNTGVTHVLDVCELCKQLFLYETRQGVSVKKIFENIQIPKVIFDSRQDCAALHGEFGIEIQGVIDLQLMELGIRECSVERLWGLERCIDQYLPLSESEKRIWKFYKNGGHEYCDGDYSKWQIRSLPEVLVDYAANDTVYMPHLYAYLMEKLKEKPEMMTLILTESVKRVADSQSLDFVTSGSLAPPAFFTRPCLDDEENLFKR
ncbi:uncharacterized protein PAC_06041 [Phialocephala subalpina]|uniref:3'-5' exonuclease domain-containing protein n=1 Tax=Phialocephala subalpina TaxID=576137 RepID=A0A1L7WTS0_9HELO|nr:uncharacterized protein PAC_06041 [Phialocephala subalpina]